ncbi:hypothetical protein GCM10022291_00480 [Postechiella marina]|uniref:DUF4252 domain-containing protein n=1 Tax=Postechiella marina TaxID=943941 RepID=A0ABP8BYL7_9FLAO
MKKVLLLLTFSALIFSCGSSFQGFYNAHKTDLGATSFQVPNFMKAVLSNISPDVKSAIGNITDVKYITLKNVNNFKREELIEEMNAVTNNGYIDVFRKNEIEQVRIVSVKEIGVVVTDAIIFNSNKTETTAYYLQGNFDPEKIKAFADENTFNNFSSSLKSSYQLNTNPSFNPNN